MGWVKFDENFARHPKLAKLRSTQARWLYLASIAYSSIHLLDGKLPRNCVKEITDFPEAANLDTLSRALVNAGLWKRTPEGYEINDYLDYQRSRQEVLQTREKGARRQAKFREQQSRKSNGVTLEPVTPLRERYVTLQEEKREEEKRNYSRPRDALWDAFVAEIGQPATDDERGRLNAALKQLRKIGATPEELSARVAEYKRRWPEMELTPQAITGNWTRLGKEAPQQNGRRPTGYRFVRGTHSGSYVADPNGTDRPPASYSLGAS